MVREKQTDKVFAMKVLSLVERVEGIVYFEGEDVEIGT